MLFERASEVSSFNRYMLPGIANKTTSAPCCLATARISCPARLDNRPHSSTVITAFSGWAKPSAQSGPRRRCFWPFDPAESSRL